MWLHWCELKRRILSPIHLFLKCCSKIKHICRQQSKILERLINEMIYTILLTILLYSDFKVSSVTWCSISQYSLFKYIFLVHGIGELGRSISFNELTKWRNNLAISYTLDSFIMKSSHCHFFLKRKIWTKNFKKSPGKASGKPNNSTLFQSNWMEDYI